MLTPLGTSTWQMVGIATNVALTTVGRCSGQACLRWRLFIAFGLIILSLTWWFVQVGMLECILRGTATLFASTTPHGGIWATGIPGSPCYTRGPTRGPILYQGAHQGAHYGPPGGPPGGPLRVLTSYFCRGMTHEIIIYNRYVSFWNRKRRFDYVFIRTISSVFPLIRGWQFMSLWLVRVIVLIFPIGERWKIKT